MTTVWLIHAWKGKGNYGKQKTVTLLSCQISLKKKFKSGNTESHWNKDSASDGETGVNPS